VPHVFRRVVLLFRAEGPRGPVILLPGLAQFDTQHLTQQGRQADFRHSKELRGHHGVEEAGDVEREIALHGRQIVGRTVQHLDHRPIGENCRQGAEVLHRQRIHQAHAAVRRRQLHQAYLLWKVVQAVGFGIHRQGRGTAQGRG
jgi:hypothetical protein